MLAREQSEPEYEKWQKAKGLAPQTDFLAISLCEMQNVFVHIDKCICPNRKNVYFSNGAFSHGVGHNTVSNKARLAKIANTNKVDVKTTNIIQTQAHNTNTITNTTTNTNKCSWFFRCLSPNEESCILKRKV